MNRTAPTEARCEAWFASIRAQHRSDKSPDLAELARAGITPIVGGGNNTLYRCEHGNQDCCIKLYRTDDRRRDEREWQAINFLAMHVPGLAPRPFAHSRDADLPLVAMEYLPGTPLRSLKVEQHQLDALAERLRQIYAITPETADYPDQSTGAATALVARVEAWAETATPPVRALLERWLAGDDPAGLRQPAAPVFGTGDPNLANWLWDGAELRRIDLEYAGWCDLANELADLVEGPWARILPDETWSAFVARFDALDRDRFAAARRLLAHFWLALFDARDSAQLAQQFARVQTVMEAS